VEVVFSVPFFFSTGNWSGKLWQKQFRSTVMSAQNFFKLKKSGPKKFQAKNYPAKNVWCQKRSRQKWFRGRKPGCAPIGKSKNYPNFPEGDIRIVSELTRLFRF
jgi:hypothetical protein